VSDLVKEYPELLIFTFVSRVCFPEELLYHCKLVIAHNQKCDYFQRLSGSRYF